MSGHAGSALIVGASSGIGAALAKKFASEGHKVALVARRAEKLGSVRAACNEAAGADVAHAYEHDVVQYEEAEPLFLEIVEDLGGLDTIVYAAGYMPSMGPDEYSLDQDVPTVQVGLIGAMAWLGAAAKKFTAQKHGRICGISSISGDRGRRAYPPYHATKAGLDTYLESLRNRLHPHKVSVTTIKPGFVDTDMTKGMEGLFWLASPEKAAELIYDDIRKRRHTRYVLRRWWFVARVIKSIPSVIFRRMDF